MLSGPQKRQFSDLIASLRFELIRHKKQNKTIIDYNSINCNEQHERRTTVSERLRRREGVKSVTVDFAGVVSYLADSAHTHILPPRVARRPIRHGLPVAVKEVLALWHAVQLARVLRCGQRALSQISHRTWTFCANATSGKNPAVTSHLHSTATTCRVSPGS